MSWVYNKLMQLLCAGCGDLCVPDFWSHPWHMNNFFPLRCFFLLQVSQLNYMYTYPLHADGLVNVHISNGTVQLTSVVQDCTVCGCGKLITLTKPREWL